MARRWVGSGALVASFVGHALLLSAGALILSHSLRDRAHAREAAARAKPMSDLEVELPHLDPTASDNEHESKPQEAETAELPAPGGGPLVRHPDTEQAGRGGSRATPLAATNYASHIDPINLEPDPLTHLDRSQVQRLRTATERHSWEDHRSTSNPMQLTFLATGPGRLQERRKLANAARGSMAGSLATPLGGTPGSAAEVSGADPASLPGAARAGAQQAAALQGARGAAPGSTPSSGGVVLTARPWVMRARPALPTETRERPNDTDDSSQAVAARVAALVHASTVGAPLGPGVGGEAIGGRPGRSGTEGMGSHTTPSGFGPGLDMLNDPGVQGFMAGLKQRVDSQLLHAFPDWAIEQGRSGNVIFELTVLADGRLDHVRMLRPSGIDEYDGKVLTGVRRIASFGPLPKALGPRALITYRYDSLNRVIGREGPGPGSYGAPRQTQ
ncbi:MAG: energy transducer TonB [Pseudomonadota bacterium]